MAESERRYTEQDLAVVDELARRAALAVDNARLYAAERRARATAESASKAKSDFLAIMSHELRTPLNAILGYTDLIAGEIVGPVNDTQRNQLGRVKASANHLLELIEQVLTLSRLEVGREQVHRTPVDVPALCRDAVSLLEPAARNRQLHLDFAISGGIGTRVTDETKLRQILINLLANAVKFTEQGEVSLVVRGDGELLRFIVRDTGVGIEAEHLQHVFDPFWQVDTRRARRTSGSGLGLSVSRDLARLLGGEIEVESVLGQGSTFTVRLPAPEAGR
jgi:signal transduction histidine kinase